MNYMKLQQRRIGEETTRGAAGESKYRTIDINFGDLDYADSSTHKLKNASPQREDGADATIDVPEGVRAQSRAGSNAPPQPKQLCGIYMNSKIDRVLEGNFNQDPNLNMIYQFGTA